MPRLSYLLVAVALALPACKKQVPVSHNDVLTSDSARTPTSPRDVAEAVDQIALNFSRIHFPYDSATLDAASKAALASNVEIMQRFPAISVEVQGHADERGTIDYNVALGQRRAETVRSYMTAMGVAPGRVQTVSYGEEAPLVRGHGEVAWAQNRRAEFRILAGSAQGIRGSIH